MVSGNNKTCKECNICSQAIQSKLSKNQDWEVKRKDFWEKELETDCKCSKPFRRNFYDSHHYEAPQHEDTYQVSTETCSKCEKVLGNVTTNKYGDENISQISHTCNNKDNERERERERDKTFSTISNLTRSNLLN